MKVKKLVLSKETLRQLGGKDLGKARGGSGNTQLDGGCDAATVYHHITTPVD